ncbi:hypothetical protein [Candidatus Parabeggiatoa sp. HSG14]|uniref:hypothetical protein n=1 Tax=Candidatus Parabeggiatoa sp. HSG14 TaxID=3055593 RepID=UPI0025A74BA9|nr:hypothetical protein [Thiotrichales bacterium HSG14]
MNAKPISCASRRGAYCVLCDLYASRSHFIDIKFLNNTETSTKTTTTAKGKLKKVSSSILESIKRNGEKDRHKKTANPSTTVRSDLTDSGLVFDSVLKDWTSAQRQRASKILKDVPQHDKQMILDELNSAVKKGTVKQVWRYLSTLVRKYQASEFVPTSNLSEHRVKPKPMRIKVKDCPHCDKRGLIRFVDERTGQFDIVVCCHDAVEIEAMRKGRLIDNA